MNIKKKMRDYKRKIHEVPRLLFADAYTIGSNEFESAKAKEKSVYYLCARKFLEKINTSLYNAEDTRYFLSGFGRIIDYCLFKPITMEEIYETDRFLANALVTTKGLAKFNYPRELWVKIVEDYGGRIPIQIKALPDGSVFYPHEPFAELHNIPEGFGVLAAWFESKTLQVWASTEMTTQIEHWLMYYGELLDMVYGNTMTDDIKDFTARLMLHNFGDRAGICPQESDWLGETVTLSVSGTDTFSGGYCAWKNSREEAGVALSVRALAHRNIESYEHEFDCFEALYNAMADGEIGSFVADCNDFFKAVKTTDKEGNVDPRCLLGLALLSALKGNGKIVVARPDSGIAVEQVLWLCRLAKEHGLYREIVVNGKTWYGATTLKFIEGDGMKWADMREINAALLAEGFLPWEWGLYGVGGGLRNDIKRDNGSFKYALCSVGLENSGRVKFAPDSIGKSTLPGPFKLLRTPEALESGVTIVFWNEEGEDARQIYYDGTQEDFFGDVMFEDNIDCKARIKEQLANMPMRLVNDIPASQAILTRRLELLKLHAPEHIDMFN
jgi:nicotinamide phosphoribosyltransferase